METVRVNTSQHVDIDYPVAGLGERIGAHLIDTAIFIVVYLLALFTFGISGFAAQFNGTFIIVLIIIYAGCYVFYDLVAEIFFNGQSFGKRLLKIKVISIDGAQPSIGQYFIRWIFRIVDFVLTFKLLGFICIAVSDDKQRIGDIVAGTTVIKTAPATKIEHIAFHPTADDYIPMFQNVALMSDRDVELIHEVVRTYYITKNPDLIYKMAEKVSSFLGVTIPESMNEMQFLNTVSADYVQITSRAV
ncbi:RDD family protein [Pedobacter sp. ASV28]|uniref:RDD family protein n=1 Tax=Pedobacter sp. ASV28 TaxID=2795123 RepID=UPI0018EB24E5|nr:RDD family protein [Pedobacter sp. ASV28]